MIEGHNRGGTLQWHTTICTPAVGGGRAALSLLQPERVVQRRGVFLRQQSNLFDAIFANHIVVWFFR